MAHRSCSRAVVRDGQKYSSRLRRAPTVDLSLTTVICPAPNHVAPWFRRRARMFRSEGKSGTGQLHAFRWVSPVGWPIVRAVGQLLGTGQKYSFGLSPSPTFDLSLTTVAEKRPEHRLEPSNAVQPVFRPESVI